MKSETVREPGSFTCDDPLLLEHVPAKRSATLTAEHAALGRARRERIEVRLDFADEKRG